MERNQIKSSEEEIDLVYYFGKFREGLNKVKEWLLRYFRILWRNFFILLLIVIIGTGAAFSLRYIIPPAYQTRGMFISHYLPANFYQQMVYDLNQSLTNKNLATVSEQMGINPDAASQITHMELKPLRDTLLDRNDTIFAPFEVTLVLRDMNGLENIQDGLLLYLEGGKKARQQKLEKRKLLDTAKQIFYERMKTADSVIIPPGTINMNPATRGKDKDPIPNYPPSYYQKYVAVDRMLDELDKIEVVQPFLKKVNHNYPNYNKYLLNGLLISLLVAMVVTPIVGRRR
jgi:hypothetical protein